MRARHTKIVMPERSMNSISITAEKSCPRNSRRIISCPCRAAAHMDRESLSPCSVLAQRRQIFSDRIPRSIEPLTRGHTAEIYFLVSFKARKGLMLWCPIHHNLFDIGIDIRMNRLDILSG